MIQVKRYLLLALSGLAILSSCNSDKEGGEPSTEYDRKAMLTNYADNLIVPAYANFRDKARDMAAAIQAFTTSPTTATLTQARAAYQEAYKAWQHVSVYEFGPAEVWLLRANLNIYPTSATKIENNITAGNSNMQATANLDAKGFPAIDYLLYGAGSDNAVVDQFVSGSLHANRKRYLLEINRDVKEHAESVHAAWIAGAGTEFKNSPGTAVGSAVGSLVNQLNFEIDLTKRAKVGIPMGKFTAGSPLPDKVEAYYSQTSLELLKQAIRAQKAIFMGASANGTDGPGLDDYLDHVNATYQGGKLSAAIIKQFDAAIAAADAVQGPLSQAVVNQSQAVTKVYDELQKLIILTKTDMPAALGVTISYNDNDGD